MQSGIRVAVVGAGGWGREHARAVAEREDAELCAIVDSNAEAARQRATEFGARGFTDLGKMLTEVKPELATVAVSNLHQFEPTRRLIRAGVPLLVEKPLAFTVKEADLLLREASERDLFFAIDFNHRYADAVKQAREAIEKGRLGDLVFAIWRFGGEPSSTPHPYANLIETQCHGFDMLEHLCGPMEAVMAEMTDKCGAGFSTLVLSVRFKSGAVGSLVGTYDSSYHYPNAHYLEVNGTLGHVVVEDTVRRFTYQAKGSDLREVRQAGYFDDAGRAFRRLLDRHLDDVLAALRAGKEPPIHASAGRRALVLAEAARASFETGRRVGVEPP